MADKKKLTPEQKLRQALDNAQPIGVKASLHTNPLATEGFDRTASFSGGDMPMGTGAGGSSSSFVGRTPLLYVDPMFDPILFLFPKDRIDEINKRLRHYYETDPIVGSAIDMHTSFPLSDFHLECEDPDNQQYWNDLKDRTGLLEFLRNMVHDYWLLGEAVGLPVWDPYNFEFSHFNQYPPENIDIVQSYVTPTKHFMLKPDPRLAEKIRSSSKLDSAIVSSMDPSYVKSLEENRPYYLGSDDKVMYLARTTTKYRYRGVSILSRALKDLLYKDKLRLLQLTFVDRHMFPIKIFKLGSEQRGWIPNKKHFQRLDALLKQASNDPDFSILYHFGLNVDYVGTKDRIQNLTPEFDWVSKQVMAALFVNEEMVHGGMPSAVRDTVNMRMLLYRYMDVREKVERMMLTHFFLPVARARGLYRKSRKAEAIQQETTLKRVAGKDISVPITWVDKEKGLFRIANSKSGVFDISVYDIPRPVWKKINLVNNTAEQQLMVSLESEGKVPLEMVLDMLGLDPRTVRQKLKDQESTRFDPAWRQLREEMSKREGINTQVLRGKKHNEWSMPAEGLAAPSPEAPGGKGGKKPAMPGLPPMPSGGGGAPKPPLPPPPGAPAPMAPGAPKPPLAVKPPPGGTPPPVMPPMGPVGPGAGGPA